MAFLSSNGLRVSVIRRAVLLILASLVLGGCVAEPDLSDEREDAILEYYMPRSTEYRYLYEYSGFFSGKRDSLFYVDYLGRANAQTLSTDGYAPVHQYNVSSIDGERSVEIDLYVSDSVVVEYGRDCSVADERFIPLSGTLRVGNRWTAAQGYKPAPGYSMSFLAEVKAHYDQIMVADSVVYKDVWQVNYTVTSSVKDPNVAPKEYLKNARRVIYFARGIGKVFEIAYSPQNEKQWQNELLRVDRR
jgi:hypothetical protein